MSRLKVADRPKTLWASFNRFVVRGESCWGWTGRLMNIGYVSVWNPEQRRQVYGHRAAWVLYRGPLTHGLELDHLCKNKPCVNPWHLEEVLHKINSRRAFGISGNTCYRGHEMDERNAYLYRGKRHCRKCAKLRRGPVSKTEAYKARHRRNQAAYLLRLAARKEAPSC